MRNSEWYILLGFASTIIFVYTLRKNRDNKLWALYFLIAGLTYFLEYFVLVILNGYAYHPKILKSEYFDNILGAIASDAFTIPMTSVYVAGFKMNFLKRLIVAAVIIAIEIIFVRMKLYEHYWWSYFYTFAGAVVIYHYAQRWLSVLHKSISPTFRYINLFLANLFIQSSIVFVLVGILNLYLYNVHWFKDPQRGHITFATLYIMFITIIFVSLVNFHLHWYWMVLGLLIPSIVDVALLKMNILYMSDKWSLLYFLIFRIIILACISLYNKYLLSDTHSLRYHKSR